jgi:hypothetical protein
MGLHLLRQKIPEGMSWDPHSGLVRSWQWPGYARLWELQVIQKKPYGFYQDGRGTY